MQIIDVSIFKTSKATKKQYKYQVTSTTSKRTFSMFKTIKNNIIIIIINTLLCLIIIIIIIIINFALSAKWAARMGRTKINYMNKFI